MGELRPASPRAVCPQMDHDRTVVTVAELSSLTSSLEDLARRVTAAAEQESSAGHDRLATELFGAERALAEAIRRMRRAQTP